MVELNLTHLGMFLVQLTVVSLFGIWFVESGAQKFTLLLTGQLFTKKKQAWLCVKQRILILVCYTDNNDSNGAFIG